MGKTLTGARGHELGLPWQLTRSPNEPVAKEVRANLLFEQCVPVQSRWYFKACRHHRA